MSNRTVTSILSGDGIPRLIGLGAIVIAVLVACGCGKKAPPVAPELPALVAVSDLQAEVQDARVTLTWQHAPGNSDAAGYLVLRSRTAVDQSSCPGCPQVFQMVKRLRLSRSRRNQAHTLTFNQDLSMGFTYVYSVRPFHTSGSQGPDSNLVKVEGLPSESPEADRDNAYPQDRETGVDG